PAVERAARRARSVVQGAEADDLEDSADALRDAIDAGEPGRIDTVPGQLQAALTMVRDAARTCWSAIPKDAEPSGDSEPGAVRQQARALVEEIRKTAARMVENADYDVLWVAEREASRGGNELRVAPVDVATRLRESLFEEKTVVLTSATLKLGGG